MPEIVVIDYGSGNTRSMINALAKAKNADQQVVLTNDPTKIRNADRLVLPGVGAFAECWRKLQQSGALESMTAAVQAGRPFLGVCVGMQILALEGHEFEVSPGLGWIDGITRRIEFPADYRGPKKLPHVGWAPIQFQDCPLFKACRPGDYFYFVHSYALHCNNKNDVIATANYGGDFTAAVLHKNIFATQFHPEKSAHAGLRLLEAFCQWKP